MRANVPTVRANVTLLTAEEGGRKTPVVADGRYMPHVVVGDPTQRKVVTDADGRTIVEEYLGVRFSVGSGEILSLGKRHEVELELMYFPNVDYTALTTGATFTVREGGRVVGHGQVVDGIERRPPNYALERTRGG